MKNVSTLAIATTVLMLKCPCDCFCDDPIKQDRPANRLVTETSPYLLQHAYNPVQWFPWGDEAFAKAKEEGKLIFLSVGYSSCHWCHVMEHESFEDEEIAGFLNENFVCIKVDREERPDVDAIYMQAVQMLTGRGGWPMSVFLTPDAKPFYGGSYYPARDGDRPGAPGFMTLITAIDKAWKGDTKEITDSANQITKALRQQMDVVSILPPAEPSLDLVDRVQDDLAKDFDSEYGGFGFDTQTPGRPKFPEPSNLVYLLARANDTNLEGSVREQAKNMLERTLDMMAAGGIQDHIGGGFHRYSVDRFWRIPHFEKMLYDNGQLASVYAGAYALTRNDEYRWIAEDLLDWVAREMTSPNGGFYSAMDADSEGEEGAFYRWKPNDIRQLLPSESYTQFASIYRVDEPPNFEEHFYVPQTRGCLTEVANSLGTKASDLRKQCTPLRLLLRKAREKREPPMTDTKILTSWNGLMIQGFADAGRIFSRRDYVDISQKAAEFVLKELRTTEGTLQRTYGSGKAKLNAYLDDYAFFVAGLLAIHQATGAERWLTESKALTDVQIKNFWDRKRGGFFFTSDNHESLIARAKDPVDSAIPSGNSVAASNLLLLSDALGKEAGYADRPYREYAVETIKALSGLLDRSPTSAPRAAVSMRRILDPRKSN